MNHYRFLLMKLVFFCLSTMKDPHPFLFSFSAPIQLLGQDFFFFYFLFCIGVQLIDNVVIVPGGQQQRLPKEISCQNFLKKREEIIPEFGSSHQSGQSGKLNDLLTPFICSVSDGRADSLSVKHLIICPYWIRYHLPLDKMSN